MFGGTAAIAAFNFGSDSPRCVRHKCQVAGAFDGGGQMPLMAGAEAGLAARVNLALYAHKLAQGLGVFIVNHVAISGAE